MALLSDYTAGTITVAANGTAVTGSGTAWLTAGFQEGDLLFAAGFVGVVQSVDSNTSLTLAQPWKGGALSGSAYRLRFQGDGSRVSAQARQLIDLLGGTGNFQAFAALVGAADKLPFFTGAGTMGLTDFKAKGKDVVASDTLLTLLGKLGPAFGGQTPIPSDAGVGLTDGDFNTIIVPGIYTISGTWSNGPSGASATYNGVLEVYARSFSNGYWQILRLGTATWRRFTSTAGAATWSSGWERIENATVGAVAQASGVPTGAIIERGSGANGEYVRFADGTQVCWVIAFTIKLASDATSGNKSASWAFPASFAGTPMIAHTISSGVPGTRGSTSAFGGSTSATLYYFEGAGTASDVQTRAFAIGRWF